VGRRGEGIGLSPLFKYREGIMSERGRKIFLGIMVVLSLFLLGCSILGDWTDMDRSRWGWGGEYGDAPRTIDGTPTMTPINPELQ